MSSRKRAGRGVVLATWLTLFTLLMASFSWLPAAAQEATPEDGSMDTELTSQQTTGEQKSLDEGDPPTTSNIQSLSETTSAAMAVSGVSTDVCGTKPGYVTGTVTVTDPVAGETITVNLVDETDAQVNTTPVSITTIDATTSYLFEIPLADVRVQAETWVAAQATYDGTPNNSTPRFAIHADSIGAVVCGEAPDSGTGEGSGEGTGESGEDTGGSSEGDPNTGEGSGEESDGSDGQFQSLVDPMAITTVSISCTAGTTTLTGAVDVTSPAVDESIDIAVINAAGGGTLATTKVSVTSADLVSVPYTIELTQVAVTAEAEVSVAATYNGTTQTSTPVTIHLAETGVVTCGAAPPSDPDPDDPDGDDEPEEPTVSYAVVTGTGVGLRCRAEPVNGTVLAVVPDGTRVEVRGAAENGWMPVKCGGSDSAWMSASYLRAETGTTPPDAGGDDGEGSYGTATVTGTGGLGLRCRTAPITGAIITVMMEGATIPLRGPVSSGWAPIECAGQAGHASATYLKLDSGTTTPPDDGGDEGEDNGDSYGTATVINTGGLGLRCRTAPVTGAIITVMTEGLTIPLRGPTQNGWAPIECAGQAGHASATYLRINDGGSTPPPEEPGDDGGLGGTGKYGTVVNTSGMGLRCRTEPVDGAIITVIGEGTRIETRGATTNGWVPVICANQKGWVSKTYFGLEGETTPPPTSGGGGKMLTVTGTSWSGLRCRTAPVSGDVIGVIPEGGRVETRGSLTNGWYPVTCFNQAGWVSATYVMGDVAGGGSGEFWIDINLSTQYMRVYRGNTVINGTYVSTGRPRFATPPGTFYIIRKLPSQTMSGVLGGEYYYVPNVPWVMYFTNRGHAIHGAYWHNNFGTVMSHGCVNLPVGFAQWLYYNTPMYTRVNIHY